ncbi:ROK family protein [candidate division KSB1 bacterium]|nr:ROK family protein [candidate division KSB1 bacterium]
MKYYIGLDLGGTTLKYALGDNKGNILVKLSRPSHAQEPQEKIFENMLGAVEKLMEIAAKNELAVTAIGVGSPGNVDFETGRIIGQTPELKDWADAPIRERLQSQFHIPVWTDNNANMVAIAEGRVGAGRGFNHVVFITVSAGIGGGIIINGQLYRGGSFNAAEIGHISIDFQGKRCPCGGIGCLETYAAAPAMLALYQKKLIANGAEILDDFITPELIFERARHDDREAMETLEAVTFYLGLGLANVVNLLNPQAIIIAGTMAEIGEDYIGRVRKVVFDRALKTSLPGLRILAAQLGNDAGVIGAILLAADNTLSLSN